MTVIINNGTMNFGPGEFSRSIEQEMQRGADVDALRDIDPQVPEGAQLTIPVGDTNPDGYMDRVESLAEQSEQEAVNANSRRTYLIQLVKEVGSQRRLEGFSVNHHREPADRTTVETRNYQRQADGKETLQRACGVCALAPNCRIKNNLGAWVATHPYSNNDKKAPYTAQSHPEVKRAEGRMKFLKRLGKDPLAHCIPPESK